MRYNQSMNDANNETPVEIAKNVTPQEFFQLTRNQENENAIEALDGLLLIAGRINEIGGNGISFAEDFGLIVYVGGHKFNTTEKGKVVLSLWLADRKENF